MEATVVRMRAKRSDSYREAGLETAVADLVRAGVSGHASGVRQIAAKLLRSVPDSVTDVDAFRREIHEAMSARPDPGLRLAGGGVPTEAEGGQRLAAVEPFPDGHELVLDPRNQSELDEVVAERRRTDELVRAGVQLTRTVMLSGPPGVGKTLAAHWVAEQVALPLVTLDLASAVSSYLGTSGRNIRSVLNYAKSGPCVLLLDEFDALAKRRDDDSDIGELKRIVNVILVELDRWPDTSLLLAATNHPHLLDPAVGRRFDRILEFELPDTSLRRAMLEGLAGDDSHQMAALLDLLAETTEGASGSDLARIWASAERRAVLHHTDVDKEVLNRLLRETPDRRDGRDVLWAAAHQRLGLSYRQIAELAGVSHPTVSRAVQKVEARR